jgi:hypothetical protein
VPSGTSSARERERVWRWARSVAAPAFEAQAVGLALPANPDGHIRTAGGVAIPYRLADTVLELRRAATVVRWHASVAFAPEPLQIVHLGYRGFLEYFACTFHGPDRKIVLDPQPGLPVA